MSKAVTRDAVQRGNRLERLREIIDGGRRRGSPESPAGVPVRAGIVARSRTHAAAVLGGTIEDGTDGPCTVVRRTYCADDLYGRHRLGTYRGFSNGALSLLAGQPVGSDGRGQADRGCRPGSVVCFDLETTGLSGGAGTVAFLVGLGWFETGAFRTCQYFLSHLGDESRMLRAVAQVLSAADTVVTFNGRSFDAPVTETRFAFHRLSSPLGPLRHVDLLHPARRLWPADECRLVRLEREVLGLHRVGDVPGAEIPARYVGFLRGGDAHLLEPVLEHNRLDLVSLGALTGLACRLVRDGAVATGGASQAFGLGRLYESAGWPDRAAACYRRAAGLDSTTQETGPDIESGAQALGRLAILYRRQQRHRDAAEVWTRLLAHAGVTDRLRCEASVSLAVHHEHRVQDLATAQRFARAALETTPHSGRRRAVEHRLTRLGRKLGQATPLLPEPDRR